MWVPVSLNGGWCLGLVGQQAVLSLCRVLTAPLAQGHPWEHFVRYDCDTRLRPWKCVGAGGSFLLEKSRCPVVGFPDCDAWHLTEV